MFYLDAVPSGGKISRRKAAEIWQEETGETPEELQDLPELPLGTEALWVWFSQLSATRGSNGFGPNVIGYRDLEAWAKFYKIDLQHWELETLLELDAAFLKSITQ